MGGKVKHFALIILLALFQGVLFAEVPLVDLADEINATVTWDYWRDIGYIEKDGTKISFRPGENYLLEGYQHRISVDYIERRLNNQIVLGKKAEEAIRLSFEEIQDFQQQEIAVIILDAGHGGQDPGAVSPFKVNGDHLLEKEVALDIVLKVYYNLKKSYPDKKILLTRTGDTYPSLEDRTSLANSVELGENEAIVFVSVHANASVRQKASGFEVWYLPPEMKRDLVTEKMRKSLPDQGVVHILNRLLDEETTVESIKLAGSILDGMADKIKGRSLNRGLKEEAWYVVRNAKMPSVLIEVGFVSNKAEATLLDTDHYKNDLANGIYNGIHRFVQQFELSNGFTEKGGEYEERRH